MSKVLLLERGAWDTKEIEQIAKLGFAVVQVKQLDRVRAIAESSASTLTLRQIYAGRALQGLIAAARISPDDPVGAAKKALAFADALIEAESQSTN